MKAWNVILSIVVAFLLIGYINLYCNEMTFNSNSAGVLISALAVAVTFLVGWQIVNAIEVNQTLKNSLKEAEAKFEQRASDLEKQIDNARLEQEATMFYNFGWDAIKNENIHEKTVMACGALSRAYSCFYNALIRYSSANSKINRLNMCISQMNLCIVLIDDLKFSSREFAACDEIYKDIKKYNFPDGILGDIQKLYSIRHKIGVNQDSANLRKWDEENH